MPNKHIDELTLTNYGVDIEKVDQFNILGFTLISFLTEVNRCSRTIRIIIKLEHIIENGIKITLCNSIILPHTNYHLLIYTHVMV